MARSVNAAALLAQRILETEEEGWIGVDLDGTLAKYNGYKGAAHIGEPVPAMAARVRRWVGRGKRVKIFTARADDEKSVNAIKKWLKDNELPDLEVTNLKDEKMIEFWDDKAVAVEKNTGKIKEAEDPKEFIKHHAPPSTPLPTNHFMTADGYHFYFDAESKLWKTADGELELYDKDGHPADEWGEPFDGQFL